jgi:hypothetical protein
VHHYASRARAYTDRSQSHRDDRVATVISGIWHIGYGERFDESKLKTPPPGSYYTEPPGQTHFAETGDEPVVVQITASAHFRLIASAPPAIRGIRMDATNSRQ